MMLAVCAVFCSGSIVMILFKRNCKEDVGQDVKHYDTLPYVVED